MPYVIIRHKVKDFTTWKPLFDQHGNARVAAGCKGGRLYRSATDPKELFILFEWDSHERAQAFVRSEDLRTAMSQAGVEDTPDIYFVDGIEAFSR